MMLNVNLAATETTGCARRIMATVKAARLAAAANLEDLTMVSSSIAACARRERARTVVKFGEKSPQLAAVDDKLELLRAQEAVVLAVAEKNTTEVLKLLG